MPGDDLPASPSIPSRLLEGPWTQDKGDFLMRLHGEGMVVRDHAAARRGLLDAIREQCVAAIWFFVGGVSLTSGRLSGRKEHWDRMMQTNTR